MLVIDKILDFAVIFAFMLGMILTGITGSAEVLFITVYGSCLSYLFIRLLIYIGYKLKNVL